MISVGCLILCLISITKKGKRLIELRKVSEITDKYPRVKTAHTSSEFTVVLGAKYILTRHPLQNLRTSWNKRMSFGRMCT